METFIGPNMCFSVFYFRGSHLLTIESFEWRILQLNLHFVHLHIWNIWIWILLSRLHESRRRRYNSGEIYVSCNLLNVLKRIFTPKRLDLIETFKRRHP